MTDTVGVELDYNLRGMKATAAVRLARRLLCSGAGWGGCAGLKLAGGSGLGFETSRPSFIGSITCRSTNSDVHKYIFDSGSTAVSCALGGSDAVGGEK
eukprot:CAMPEP_0115881198 /NCGR_PEP_ID=MMETSP0287-20121206/28299_1 /TAXON_ID=412157 /ORGANISM="Chrysochromulina rotalis, Strain UIO044" /LENGTH=97 /DNA_ID=CAMNT_0003337105 /DNA_START=65 /DNA_END=355 /DNA_ORIENTATION=+